MLRTAIKAFNKLITVQTNNFINHSMLFEKKMQVTSFEIEQQSNQSTDHMLPLTTQHVVRPPLLPYPSTHPTPSTQHHPMTNRLTLSTTL